MPPDGGRIENDFGAVERGQTRRFRIPLVPAHQRRNARIACIETAETKIARREVEFFEIERIVGDVHLAIHSSQRTVSVNHDGGVVIHARGPALEDRRNYHDAEFLRKAAQGFGG